MIAEPPNARGRAHRTLLLPITDTERRESSFHLTDNQLVPSAMRESEERSALAVRGANEGLWDWNLENNRICFSPCWKSMLGYEDDEIASDPDEWFKRVHPEDILRVKDEIDAHLQATTPRLESQHRMHHKDGTYRWMNVRAIAALNKEKKPIRLAGSASDITHRKVADVLTDLPNRGLFLERLDAALDRVKQERGPIFAVLFLDVDRFKAVNDRLGHPLGDQLLVAISRRLETCLRTEDTISRIGRENLLARLGGDEFTILVSNIQELSQATALADRILKELSVPFDLNGNEVFITASIGIALSDTDYGQAKDLLRDADTAMYEAKAKGKGRCEVFDTVMRDRVQARNRLETELRRGVANQEFVVYYQPLISLNSGRVSGFEALLRWQHPDRGLLSPSEFISVAEETGLIVALDEWVLRQAIPQLKEWQDRFATGQPLTISVNFSSRQFQQPDIVEQIGQVLKESGLEGSSLELEITETQMMENRESVSSVLAALRALNIRLTIDDFGTGYSSLSYLQRFPVQRLKIDRSFVSRMCLDQEDRAIVQTIVALAHNLKLHLVAEGVENAEQLQQLKELGCEYAQGYLFSKPVDRMATEEFIQRSEAGTCRGSNLDLEKCHEQLTAIQRVLSDFKDFKHQFSSPGGVGLVRPELLSESSIGVVICSKLKNICINARSAMFKTLKNRSWLWNLATASSLLLVALVAIRIFHQSENRPPLADAGESQALPTQNGNLKNLEDSRSQGLLASEDRFAGTLSSDDLNQQAQRGLQPSARQIVAPKLDGHPVIQKITSLPKANQTLESRPQIYSVVHDHALGNCHGQLAIDEKSIAFIPSDNSTDGFKSSLSEIIGIEVRDTLTIKFKNRNYHFKTTAVRGTKTNRAEVEAIYRGLTRFTM